MSLREKVQVGKEGEISRPLVCLSELVLSLNMVVAYLFVLLATTNENSTLFPLVDWQWAINQLLHRNPHSHVGANAALALLIAIWTACLLTIVRLLSTMRIVKDFVFLAAGGVSVLAAPTCMIWANSRFQVWRAAGDGISAVLSVLLIVEPVLAVIWLISQALTKGTYSQWKVFAFIALHYGLWTWIFWTRSYESVLPLVVPAVGTLSCYLWMNGLAPNQPASHPDLLKA
jgi:hypothetical protein